MFSILKTVCEKHLVFKKNILTVNVIFKIFTVTFKKRKKKTYAPSPNTDVKVNIKNE